MTVRRWTAVFAASLCLGPASATSHEGHDQAPGAASGAGGAGSRVLVSSEARQNLGLEVAEAELRPMETTLPVVGQIAAIPNRSGTVASRIAGRVSWVGVAEGDAVRKGQPLIEIESLQLGDPPPRARYAAPIDGTVIDRHVVPGDSVEPNVHVLEIADLREVLAVGQLFEGQISRVAVGQAVRVRVPSYPDASFDGSVERVGAALDPATRALPFYVRIPNSERKLIPGMRAEIVVITARSENALAVPRRAVLGDFGSAFVFVEQEPDIRYFERVPVVTGLSDDRFVEVLEGVLPGDRVVTQGNYSLQFLTPAAEDSGEHVESAAGDLATQGPSAQPAPGRARLLAVAAGALIAVTVVGIVLRRRRSARGRA